MKRRLREYEEFNNRGFINHHNETLHCSSRQRGRIDILSADNVV